MDKQILITGAGTGIGRAVALFLAKAGCRIVLMGRNEVGLKESAVLLPGGPHIVAAADICDVQSIRSALEGVGVLYAIVANAGVGGENHYGDGDRWHEVINTNLTGTYNLVNEALPYLTAQRQQEGFRHIVLISSVLARLGVPGYSAYCASKAGMLGLMRSWAAAFTSQAILVNAICPGWVDTAMAREGLDTFAEASGKSSEQIYQEQMAMVPLGKMSTPVEIAGLVAYLIGDEQTSITGQTLDINNGALMPC